MNKLFLDNIEVDGRRMDILIDGHLIAAMTPHESDAGKTVTDADVIDCSGKVAVPGFVNMHTHAAMTLMRGMGEDMLLEDWLNLIWRVEERLDAPFVYWGTKVAALEMIKTGTTAFKDQYWFSTTGRVAAQEMSIRTAVSYVFLDHLNHEEAEREKEQCIKMHSTMSDWDERSMFTLGIHAVYSVSEELIIWAAEYARKHGLKIDIHVAESEKEVLDCKAAHGGLSPVEYLDALGVLGPDIIAAHTLWLSDHDIELLGRNKVNCVHNINSNAKLSSGYKFKWKELSEAGANVCLGTDGCASSNNLDMLEAMKTTALFQKAWRKDPSALPLQTLIDMATVNGAKALGINTGKLEVGREADILIVDTDNTFFLSPGPFLANFIYSSHSDCISTVIAGGKIVMRDRKVEGEKEILSRAREMLGQISIC